MLIRLAILDRIMAGEIDTVFRRQVRPTVKAAGTLRTARGVLEIVAVDAVAPADVTDDDARRAGFADRSAVLAFLASKPDGTDYRVRVRPGGADPRVELRESADLSDADRAELRTKLDRLDARSTHGPWTRTVLDLIAERPFVRAPDLAATLGLDTPTFKADVRKLKALGLTISHSPGYELSPRGRALLAGGGPRSLRADGD
jgi:hypothetical protein